MPCKYSKAKQRSSRAKLAGAKNEMQKFRDLMNSNPNRKGARLPRVR